MPELVILLCHIVGAIASVLSIAFVLDYMLALDKIQKFLRKFVPQHIIELSYTVTIITAGFYALSYFFGSEIMVVPVVIIAGIIFLSISVSLLFGIVSTIENVRKYFLNKKEPNDNE